MNINNLTAAQKTEFKGATEKLTKMFEAGQMDLVAFVQAKDRLLAAYLKAQSKPRKASPKANQTYRVRDLTSFVPKFIGDLYPTREAAESARNSLPFSTMWASEVVVA